MSRDDLNVLVVSAHLPFPPRWGFGTRTYQLARQLAARHRVTFLCYASPDEAESVEQLRYELDVEVVEREPQSVLGKRATQLRSLASRMPYDCYTNHSRELQAAIDRICASRPIDVVQIESTLLWSFRYPPPARIVLDEHNVDYEVYARMREAERSPLRRAFYRFEELRFRRYERRAWRDVAGCVMTSEREAEIVRALAPDTPVAAVPNAVDVDYFRPSGVEPEPRTLVFNGVLDYRPNLDGATFLADEVLPLVRQRFPDVRLTIVGRGDPATLEAFRRRGVEVTGEVPDVRPYLERAEAVVVPIRMGSGTRLKVVEGLALARPIVSTTVGCEGVDVRDEEHLLIGDTAAEFADRVVRVLEDPAAGERLGRAGRALMVERYSWDYAGERLEELYSVVLGRGAAPTERETALAAP